MESARTFTVTLKEMVLLLSHATMAIDQEVKERVLNLYANELEEKMGVTRKELQEVFDYIGCPFWNKEEEEEVEEPCGHCAYETATMPNDFTEEGRVCADCYWDIREAFKREKFESSQPPSTQYSSQLSNQSK